MTERFMIDDAGTLIDMQTRNTYDYVSDVCGLLNELTEEKEQLKHDATVLICSNQEYRKENEQLKEERDYFERKKCEYHNKWNLAHLDNINLRKENEQLKQSNQEAIELIYDGIVEMHDGKRDYAETLFNKAIEIIGD